MDIKIYKDGSLKFAYGGLLIIFLIIALILYLLGKAKYATFLFGAFLLLILVLPQLDSRPLLIIDKNGFTKKGKQLIRWEDIEKLIFVKRKFENSSWTDFEIWHSNKSKPTILNLKRTTAKPEELYLELVKYSDLLRLEIYIKGLDKW